MFFDILPLLDSLTVESDRKHGERERGAGHASKAPGQIQTKGVVATWSVPQTAGLLWVS